jgi:uncharacterized lipoprotein YmbA
MHAHVELPDTAWAGDLRAEDVSRTPGPASLQGAVACVRVTVTHTSRPTGKQAVAGTWLAVPTRQSRSL